MTIGATLVPSHLLFGIAILKEKTYSDFYGFWFIGSGILILLFILLHIIIGFDASYIEEVIKIVGQKIVLFLVVFGTTVIQSYGIRRQILRNNNGNNEIESIHLI